ncbi:DUF3558 family protein [Streptomyces alkaliterrae]|uniref:DUF3558 family protein n=1 Tax=Streptomyces alkaliterrae TaxID=2213162 RepID=A0A7W3WLL4_9ACTN|nr:DUF3558 family protein [Streptomyces alkaliterrae]MBB1254405.1 DUF3558 family protein [Streptomyces alkaliterrae]MBB1259440.1 DUF3558 family protein [Streptomyces alkaliterrae]
MLALTGCGSDSDSPDGAKENGANASAGATPEPGDQESGQGEGAGDAAGDGGGTAAIRTDPCELASKKDVEGVLGTPVLKVEKASVGSSPVCSWAVDEGGFGISVSVKSENGRTDFEQQEQTARDSTNTQKVEKVTGVGDAAFERHSGYGPTLWMLRGDLVLEIQYQTSLAADRGEMQRKMGRLIASKS